MYKPLFYIFFYLVSISAFAQQNLVYNGDFEIYDTCPSNLSIPNDMQINYCTGWYSPTNATSDYYNACNSGFVSVPNNVTGHQSALSGVAYVGLIPIHNSGNDYGFWFEYIQTKLIKPLLAGNEYHLSFYINVSDFSNDYSFKTFGAYLSKFHMVRNDVKPFDTVTPQVYYSDSNFISDTVNWIVISGDFISKGGEEYLTIGMFTDTTHFDTICNYSPYSCDFTDFSTYYYVDDVELVEKKEIKLPNVFTPNRDGENDLLQINFSFKEIVIYNRWGKEVFNGDSNSFWDGKTKEGKEVPEGVYYYIITANEGVYKGYVQLLR